MRYDSQVQLLLYVTVPLSNSFNFFQPEHKLSYLLKQYLQKTVAHQHCHEMK